MFTHKTISCNRGFSRILRRTYSENRRISHQIFPEPKEFKVVLDHQTLYINQEMAEALGWKSEHPVQLTLNGLEPTYFTITPAGTTSDRLARSTVESSQNPNIQKVLELLK